MCIIFLISQSHIFICLHHFENTLHQASLNKFLDSIYHDHYLNHNDAFQGLNSIFQ